MRVFLGGVSSEYAHGGCVESFLNIRLRPGDGRKYQWRTRGDVARTELCEEFLQRKEFDALFLADVDMLFNPDCLEQLRSHDLHIVGGHYFRRRFNPMISIAETGDYPGIPLWDIPDDGLIEVSNSGFGCLLIKREVLESIQKTLEPKEPILGMGPLPEMTNGDHGPFGADYFFSARARKLGYKHWLDCNPVAEARHSATVFLDRELYRKVRGWQADKAAEYMGHIWSANLEVRGMERKTSEVRLKQLQTVRQKYADELRGLEEQVEVLRNRLAVADGQIAERSIDLQLEPDEPETVAVPNSPKPEFISKLPVFANQEEAQKALARRGKGLEGENLEEAEIKRDSVGKNVAKGFVEALDGNVPLA